MKLVEREQSHFADPAEDSDTGDFDSFSLDN